jgi:hypothetical protein
MAARRTLASARARPYRMNPSCPPVQPGALTCVLLPTRRRQLSWENLRRSAPAGGRKTRACSACRLAAPKGEDDENTPSESDQEQQASAADPGKGTGGAEQSPHLTAAAEEVD